MAGSGPHACPCSPAGSLCRVPPLSPQFLFPAAGACVCKAPAPAGSCFARWASSCAAATAMPSTDLLAVPVPLRFLTEPALIVCPTAATIRAESVASKAVGLRDTQSTWIRWIRVSVALCLQAGSATALRGGIGRDIDLDCGCHRCNQRDIPAPRGTSQPLLAPVSSSGWHPSPGRVPISGTCQNPWQPHSQSDWWC